MQPTRTFRALLAGCGLLGRWFLLRRLLLGSFLRLRLGSFLLLGGHGD